MSFATWTVCPYKPIEKHADNFWTLKGSMPSGAHRVMSLAKLQDGRVVVHNAIAMHEPDMQQLEAWGEPAFLVVPGGFHRQDARIWKQRYPRITVLCPHGAAKSVAKVVKPEGNYASLPKDEGVKLVELASMKHAEGYMRVHSPSGTTVVFNDAVANVSKGSLGTRLMMGPIGRPSVPRVVRFMLLRDTEQAKRELEAVAALPQLERVIVAHGQWITENASERLREVARLL